VALYHATDGPNWRIPWDLTLPITQWMGVTLDSNHCVSKLELPFFGLAGEIPEQIGDLKELEKLDLSNNSIEGKLPAGFYLLNKLNFIYLYLNKINDTISSDIGNLKNLEVLDISTNQ